MVALYVTDIYIYILVYIERIMPYWTSSRVGPIVVDIHKKKSKKKTDDVATKNTPPPPQRRGITMEVRLKTWGIHSARR